MRRKVVAGNWKMNMTPSEAVALVKKLKPNMENSDVGRYLLRSIY